MIDVDAAIGFVVAKGDEVDRARLSWLRKGIAPDPQIVDVAEAGQTADGGWPALWAADVASVDATCFRLAELDDLGALRRPAVRRALDWLVSRQRPDGTWEEDESLAPDAPAWARPGDPEARLYLTANAAFWLTVAGPEARPAGPLDTRPGGAYAGVVAKAAQVIAGSLRPDGTWPSFLVTGWLGAAVLYRQEMYYEWARMQMVLANRLPDMTPWDLASLAAALRRVGVPADDQLVVAALRRLGETQRSDGGWPSEDGEQFDVHVALAVIRALR
jgi:hypothetical protein